MLADWGKTSSVCEALWAAAEAPDTTISVTLTAATGAQFVFPILPEYPTAGGAGTDAQTVDFTFNISFLDLLLYRLDYLEKKNFVGTF